MQKKLFNFIYTVGLVFSWLLLILTIYAMIAYNLKFCFSFMLVISMPVLALSLGYKYILLDIRNEK